MYQNSAVSRIRSIFSRFRRNNITPKVGDDFTTHLQGVNGGFLEVGNLDCFDYAIKNLSSDSPIVEIGSFTGLSTNLINYYRRQHGKTNVVFNCDRWEPPAAGRIAHSEFTFSEMFAFAESTYRRNVEMFSRDNLPHTIREWSDDFFALWRKGAETKDIWGRTVRLGGPISFCFIDGNHSYAFAKRDFDNTDEFLEPGGFVLFDDSGDGTIWECGKIAIEVKQNPRYEVVSSNPNYLFRKLR